MTEAGSELAVGFSLGNDNGFVAVAKSGHAEILANELGERQTPSIVAHTNGETTVGIGAKNTMIRFGRCTIANFVGLLGKKYEEIDNFSFWKRTCKPSDSDGKIVFEIPVDGDSPKSFSVGQATTVLLQTLRETASQTGQPAKHIVVAVPYGCGPAAQAELRSAADAAGLSIMRFISEPAAALMAYEEGQADRSVQSTVLVVDVGKCKTSASVVRSVNGMYHVKAHSCNQALGGQNLDASLVDFLKTEFVKKTKLDISDEKRALAKLTLATEAVRKTLSTVPSSQLSVDSLHEGVDFHFPLARARFEGMCGESFKAVLDVIRSAISEANLDMSTIDKVILAGGVCKTPKLKSMIRDLVGRDILVDTIPSDEVFALGASREAAHIVPPTHDDEIPALSVAAPSTAADIAIQAADGSMTVIIPKNTPIPARCKFHIKTQNDKQKSLAIKLFEVSSDSDDSTNILEANLKDLVEANAGEVLVDASVTVERSGVIKLHLKDLKSGKMVNVSA